MTIFKKIPEGFREENGFYHFDTSLLHDKKTGVFRIHTNKQMALHNFNRYHIKPVVCSGEPIPDHTIYLLWENADGYGVALALVDKDVQAWFTPEEDGFAIEMKGELTEGTLCLMYTATGSDPYELTKSAVAAVCKKMKTFKLREEKAIPAFVDYFGWCTWDAFKADVTAEKVFDGLNVYKAAGFPLKFLLVDDGVWVIDDDARLTDIAVNSEKFPCGFNHMVNKAKQEYGIEIFGLWHCFQAYWRGINADSSIAKEYRYLEKEIIDAPWEKDAKPVTIRPIHPDDIYRFYNIFHYFIKTLGVDMVKIDGQSTMEEFGANVMQAYQRAMQASASMYFNKQIIHCMSASTTVAYNMLATNCQRNSDDYVVTNSLEKQKEHVYVNAINNMFTSNFCIPDWDMFQSHSTTAEFHAAARAISGGPVYVSDYPGKQNFDILNALVLSDGTTLRCKTPALPARDSLFADPCKNKTPLKLFNLTACGGVLAMFNCYEKEEPVLCRFSSSDIEGLIGETFAVYSFKNKTLTRMESTDISELEIPANEFEILSFMPIHNDLAPLGLLDKYNGSAAVISFDSDSSGNYIASFADGGKIGFYSKMKPTKVTVNDYAVPFEYDANGLLTVNCETIGNTVIKIAFSCNS